MKGAFLIVTLLLAGVHLPEQVEAMHGLPHSLLTCGDAIRDVCRTICNLTGALPFRVIQAVIDCLPVA